MPRRTQLGPSVLVSRGRRRFLSVLAFIGMLVLLPTLAAASGRSGAGVLRLQTGGPVNNSAPTVSGNTSVGSTLTANPGSWTGANSFSYQWQRCSPYSAAVVSDQPVGYWRLGEVAGSATAVDSSGYGNDGAFSGSVLALAQPGALGSTNGEVDKAIQAGTVTVPDATALNAGSVSVEAWVKYSPNNTTAPIIAKRGAGGSMTTPQWALWQAGTSSFSFSINNRGGRTTISASTSGYSGPRGPVTGWWHLVGTFDGQVLRLYLNGTLATSQTLAASNAGPIFTYPQPLVLGNDFFGFLDEVSVYNTVLTQAQIQAHFNAASPVGCSDISGATSDTYGVAAADSASRLRVNVTATGDSGTTLASASPTILATNQRPRVVTAPTVAGTSAVGATLTASSGSWTRADSYAYQWQRCSSYSAAVAASGPVAYWRLGEAAGAGTAADSSGYGNDGAYSGSTIALGQSGALGSWDGETDTALKSGTATIPDANALNPGANLSVEAWVLADPNTASTVPIVVKAGVNGSTTAPQYALYQAGTSAFSFTVTVLGRKITATAATGGYAGPRGPATGWWHLVGTYDGTAVRLYLNGTLTAAQTTAVVAGWSGPVSGYSQPVVLGNFNGSLDEVSIYGSALTQSQVQAHFNAAATVGCTNIADASGQTYDLTAADLASRIRVAVTATNTAGGLVARSDRSALVTNERPRSTAAPLINGTPVIGSTLTASQGTWSAASSYAYQWQRCESYAGAVATDKPAGWWRLGDAAGATVAADSSGYANSGIYSGGSGRVSGALGNWSGESDTALTLGSVTIPNSNALNSRPLSGATAGVLGSGWSVEAWVKRDQNLSGNATILSNGTNWALTQSASTLGFTITTRTATGTRTYTVSFSPASYTGPISFTDYWHVVAVVSFGTLRLYANGTLLQSTQSTTLASGSALVTGSQPVVIAPAGNDFMDEVALYNAALTQAQVQAHWNAGTTFGCTNITAATGQTYSLTRSDAGSRLRVLVTGTNQAGSVTSTSTQTAKIDFPFPGAPMQLTFGDGGGSDSVDPSASIDGVNTATGAYSTSAVDASLAGIGVPFRFGRTYTSADQSGDMPAGRFGPGWSDSYSSSLTVDQGTGNILLHTDNGQWLVFNKQGDGSYKSDGASSSALISVSGGFDLVRTDRTVLHFSTIGQLASMHDRNGQGLTFTYGASPNCGTITDSGGRTITFTCNTDGTVSKITLPDARKVQYAYTGGLLTSVTDLAGGVWTYAYDGNKRLTTVTDPNNHAEVTNVYDNSTGRVTSQTDAVNKTTSFAWDPATETATVTDPRGGVTTHTFLNNALMKIVDPLGSTTRYLYDANLNVTERTDPRGNKTTMTYDGHHNMLTRTAPVPLSYQEAWVYDSLNDVTSYTDRRGNTTLYSYDAGANLTAKTQPGSIVTQYGRDPAGTGLLVSLTDPRGKATQFAYDSQHNLTSSTSPVGEITTLSYDASGRLTSQVDPRGNQSGAVADDYKTTFAYDALDRKISQTDPLGHQTQWTYDPVGNQISSTDASNHITSYTYDAADQLASVSAPGGATTTYTYDGNGNLLQRTDPNTHVTSWSYDSDNRLSSTTDPLSRSWSYAYDANGNKTQTTNPGNTAVTYVYDVLNRLSSLSYSDTTPGLTFSYDGNGNRTALTDGAGNQSYSYDALDRLTAVSRGSDSFGYVYDVAGNLTSRTYPGGIQTTYTYDDDGRMASATSGGDTTSYAYDLAGNPVTATLPASNGFVETRAYDHAGRVTEVKNAAGANVLTQYDYLYDPIGKATEVTKADGSVESYEYDNRGRLTSVCYQASCPNSSDPFIRWTYDAVGNRLTEVRPSGTATYSYDPADELTQTVSPSATTSYSYDARGNQTQAGAETYSYDLADRLTSVTVGSTTTNYSYDGDGNRLNAATGETTTNYLWDSNNAIPELAVERDGSGTALRTYIRGLDTISLLEGGGTYYYHHDRLGSITALTSSSGATEWDYTYEPFGSPELTHQVDPNAPVNPLGFDGQYLDPTSNLIDLRARQYNTETGLFLSTDPKPAGPTSPYEATYDYASQDPINNYDLDGNAVCNGALAIPCGLAPRVATGSLSLTLWGVALLGAGYELARVLPGGNAPPQHTESIAPTATTPTPAESPNILQAQEHTKDARPSTQEKHEAGQARIKQKFTDKKRQKDKWVQNPNKRTR
jgi:RHS repeat-associated protein